MLKRLSVFHFMTWAPWQRSVDRIHVGIFLGLSILFHWSICGNATLSDSIAFIVLVRIGSVGSLLSIVLANFSLVPFHVNFRINCQHPQQFTVFHWSHWTISIANVKIPCVHIFLFSIYINWHKFRKHCIRTYFKMQI